MTPPAHRHGIVWREAVASVRHQPARQSLRGALLGLLLPFLAGALHAAPVTALAYTGDGTLLASGESRVVVLRTPAEGAPVARIPVEFPKVLALAPGPGAGAGILAAGGGTPGVRGGIAILDIARRRLLGSVASGSDVVTGIAYDPPGTRIAAASADGKVRVVGVGPDGTPGAEVFILSGHTGPVLAVAFSPDGRLILTGGADGSVKAWSADDGRLLRSLRQHTDAVTALVFLPVPAGAGPSAGGPEGPPLSCASGSLDRTVRIWQPGIGRMVRSIRRHEGTVLALAVSPDGASLFSAGREGVVRQLDPGSDTVVREWRDPADWIQALTVSPDGRRLASGDWSGEVRVRALDGR